MEINLQEQSRNIFLAFFLLVLPWIFIILGVSIGIHDLIGPGWGAWYYILAVTWFGAGVIFFQALQ